jgi:hypothetical protein
MSTKQPRRIYQIDGINGGMLNIAERPKEPFVVLVISNGETEAQIRLSQDDFKELADLQYSLRFAEEAQAQPALKIVA